MTSDMGTWKKCFMAMAAAMALAAGAAHAADRPVVLATTPDMASLVEPIAGDLVDLQVILPPGADPHAFSITSVQIQAFRKAALVVYAFSQAHEFETALKHTLADKPSLDWDDYAAQGATLRDYPEYPRNPHAPWLRLDNASAIARAVAAKLEQMGLPGPVLQGRLALFEHELAAQRDLCLRVAKDRGLAGRPMLAIIPGVCDIIANFGVPVGDVLMAEGSGTVAGKRLQDTVAKLRSGQYAAIVCPISMRQTKQGDAARQIASDSGAPIVYVHFLDTRPGKDTYLSQRADEIVAVAGVGVKQAAGGRAAAGRYGPWGYLLAAVAGIVLGLALGSRLKHRPRPSCGAGIFE